VAIAKTGLRPAAIAVSLAKIITAAKDIRENSDVLTETVGAPENPVPYSPEAPAGFRQQAQKEHAEAPGIFGWLGSITESLGVGWIGTGLAALWGVWATLKKKQTDKKLMGTWEGIQQFKKTLGSEDASMIDKLHAGLRTGQSLYGVWQEIAPELKRLKALGRLSQDPERTTPPAQPSAPPG